MTCCGMSLFEASLTFLYQDQIAHLLMYSVLGDGAQGLTQTQPCSASELAPSLRYSFPLVVHFLLLFLILVCVSFKHTADIATLFR